MTVQDASKFPSAFDQALNAGNLGDLLSLYDEEAIIRTADSRIEQGLAAIRVEMANLIASKAKLVNTMRHTFQSGDTALIIVDWELAFATPDGQRIERRGTATNVLGKDPEHGWRLLVANPQGTE